MKGIQALLIVIVVLLILFFCPIFLIAIGAVLFGGVLLVALCIGAIGAILYSLIRLAQEPERAKKAGAVALIIGALLPQLTRIPSFTRFLMSAGAPGSAIFNSLCLAVTFYGLALVLIYRNRNVKTAAGKGWDVTFIIICLVWGCGLQIIASLGYGFLVTLAGLALVLISVLLLLRRKAKDVQPGPEERRALSLAAGGVLLSVVLDIVSNLIMLTRVPIFFLGYLNYIPLILTLVGAFLLLTVSPAVEQKTNS